MVHTGNVLFPSDSNGWIYFILVISLEVSLLLCSLLRLCVLLIMLLILEDLLPRLFEISCLLTPWIPETTKLWWAKVSISESELGKHHKFCQIGGQLRTGWKVSQIRCLTCVEKGIGLFYFYISAFTVGVDTKPQCLLSYAPEMWRSTRLERSGGEGVRWRIMGRWSAPVSGDILQSVPVNWMLLGWRIWPATDYTLPWWECKVAGVGYFMCKPTLASSHLSKSCHSLWPESKCCELSPVSASQASGYPETAAVTLFFPLYSSWRSCDCVWCIRKLVL